MPSMAGGCAQAMSAAARDEDERSGWAGVFLAVERHDVLALQHIERLGAIVVHMDRRPAEPGGSSASRTETTPDVCSALAFIVIPNSPRLMTLPRAGPTTKAWVCSAIV